MGCGQKGVTSHVTAMFHFGNSKSFYSAYRAKIHFISRNIINTREAAETVETERARETKIIRRTC